MSLVITQPTEGSYVPLKRMFKDPKQWSISTIDLLHSRIMEIIVAHEFEFKIEDGLLPTKDT